MSYILSPDGVENPGMFLMFGSWFFIASFSLIPALFIAFTLRHIKQKPEINYLNVTPTQPIPTAPTNAFSDLATDNAPRAK